MKLSSQNNRILVCSDIHHHTYKLHDIIRRESPDFIVVLGDWFDSFHYDTLHDCDKTARYLKKFTHHQNTITLWGNHDLHYFYSSPVLRCSGYTLNKDACITEALYPFFDEVKSKFKWYVWIDDYLCTHAGLHPSTLPPLAKDVTCIDEFLAKETENAHTDILAGKHNWVYGAGRARGGYERYGGIVWLDFDDEFIPIEGLKQIVGHTYRRNNRVQKHWEDTAEDITQANNLCIDTNLDEYLIIHNGKITIKSYKET